MQASATNRTQDTIDAADDSVTLYLHEISRVPLLTPARELELAERIAQGDEAAVRLLVESNLRLVVQVARSFHHDELSLLDLIQEGNLGLLRAARKFDHRLGYRFSSYAIWWIRQAVTRAIYNKGRAIRVPVYAAEGVARVRRSERRGGQQDSQTAAPRPDRRRRQPSTKIIELASRVQQPLSLDRYVNEMVLAETLMDERAESPPEAAETCQLRDQLHTLLAQLPARQRSSMSCALACATGTGAAFRR